MREKRTRGEIAAGRKAVDKMGGPAEAVRLIKKVCKKDISAPSVCIWQNRGVPPHWAAAVYDITGVPPWATNPGVFPAKLATGPWERDKVRAKRAGLA